jgi:acetyl esterase/lipase
MMLALTLHGADTGARGPERVDLQENALAAEPMGNAPQSGKSPSPAARTPVMDLHRTTITSPKGTIVVCPGGGYHGLAMKHEGVFVADFLNAQGYDVAILEYTVGQGSEVRTKALEDALAAVSLLRKGGDKLGMHTATLGMMGFSAGGHLTARTVHELGAGAPFAKVILIYPAYLDGPAGINDAVLPPKGAKAQLFVLIGDKDKPEWVSSSKAYAEAAKANGQDAEFHLLPAAGHGFGIRPENQGSTADWPGLLAAFLAKKRGAGE